MENVGHIWRIKPGKVEDYDRKHSEIWPELAKRFEEAGVRSYHIYRWGDLVFSHMDVDDFNSAVCELAEDPISMDWERYMDDLIEYPQEDPDTGWPHRLKHVWSLGQRQT